MSAPTATPKDDLIAMMLRFVGVPNAGTDLDPYYRGAAKYADRFLASHPALQSPAPAPSPWNKNNPCPWCKSCGLPAEAHKEGGYCTGSDGELCKAFVAWEYDRPAPVPAVPALAWTKRAVELLETVTSHGIRHGASCRGFHGFPGCSCGSEKALTELRGMMVAALIPEPTTTQAPEVKP